MTVPVSTIGLERSLIPILTTTPPQYRQACPKFATKLADKKLATPWETTFTLSGKTHSSKSPHKSTLPPYTPSLCSLVLTTLPMLVNPVALATTSWLSTTKCGSLRRNSLIKSVNWPPNSTRWLLKVRTGKAIAQNTNGFKLVTTHLLFQPTLMMLLSQPPKNQKEKTISVFQLPLPSN